MLLGIGIYLLIDESPRLITNQSSNIEFCKNTGIENASAQEGEFIVAQSEQVAICKACAGDGHNPLEVSGDMCTVCSGNGKMNSSEMEKRYSEWLNEVIVCKMCGGTGQSYEAQTTSILDRDLIAPPGYYNCRVCNGKKELTRGQFIKNFNVANQVYGPAM